MYVFVKEINWKGKGEFMKNLGYYNGRYGLLEYMSIPMLDRSIAFGDAIYESVYTRNYIPYSLNEHIDRFFKSAEFFHINSESLTGKVKYFISICHLPKTN